MHGNADRHGEYGDMFGPGNIANFAQSEPIDRPPDQRVEGDLDKIDALVLEVFDVASADVGQGVRSRRHA